MPASNNVEFAQLFDTILQCFLSLVNGTFFVANKKALCENTAEYLRIKHNLNVLPYFKAESAST